MSARPTPLGPGRLALLGALVALAGCSRTATPPPSPPTTGTAGSTVSQAPPATRPPFRCVEDAALSAPGLVAEAEAALEADQLERALGCADEALRTDPRSARGLAVRGDTLSALGRVREAQLAFARALAIDPDDPVALAGAADLHVRRLDGAHDALEAGLEQALRGLRSLTRVLRRDPGLALRLELAAAAALDDLGRAGEALVHAERAVALRPDEPAAQSERGYALFELCRFDEAQVAFEATLKLAPDDPWALHELGLLAERRGEASRAAALLARAGALEPGDFPPEVGITPKAFRAEVDRAVAELPTVERKALVGVPVEVADLPSLEDLTTGQPPLSPTILGLFRGPPLDEACQPDDGDPCRSIVLYRKNLSRFARDPAELGQQIRLTLRHELGHLRGEDDDALRDRGLE